MTRPHASIIVLSTALLAGAALAGCLAPVEPADEGPLAPPGPGADRDVAMASASLYVQGVVALAADGDEAGDDPPPDGEGAQGNETDDDPPPDEQGGTQGNETGDDTPPEHNQTAGSTAEFFAQVHVTFTAVEIHSAGGGDDDAAGEEGTQDAEPPDEMAGEGQDGGDGATPPPDDEEAAQDEEALRAGWHTLVASDAGITVDLLNATDTLAAFLGEAEVPVGRYTQLRIHIQEAWGIDHDGGRHDITVPSDKVRFQTPFVVAPGNETRVVLAIDLDQSLRAQGPTGWMLHPVPGEVRVDHVPDEHSGEDVHEEGEVVPVEEEAPPGDGEEPSGDEGPGDDGEQGQDGP